MFHSILKLELCRHACRRRDQIIPTYRYGKNMPTTALLILYIDTRFSCAENCTPQDHFRCAMACYHTHMSQKTRPADMDTFCPYLISAHILSISTANWVWFQICLKSHNVSCLQIWTHFVMSILWMGGLQEPKYSNTHEWQNHYTEWYTRFGISCLYFIS